MDFQFDVVQFSGQLVDVGAFGVEVVLHFVHLGVGFAQAVLEKEDLFARGGGQTRRVFDPGGLHVLLPAEKGGEDHRGEFPQSQYAYQRENELSPTEVVLCHALTNEMIYLQI